MQYYFFPPIGDLSTTTCVTVVLTTLKAKSGTKFLPHTMHLAEVTQQSTAEDVVLIKAIDECSRGCPSKVMSEFLTSLD